MSDLSKGDCPQTKPTQNSIRTETRANRTGLPTHLQDRPCSNMPLARELLKASFLTFFSQQPPGLLSLNSLHACPFPLYLHQQIISRALILQSIPHLQQLGNSLGSKAKGDIKMKCLIRTDSLTFFLDTFFIRNRPRF